jgi:DNA-binding response OmpR family regulator
MTQDTFTESAPRLLIADDEEVFLLSTADLLRQEGYAVDCAQDEREALARLRETRYDLLISDIRMPGNLDLAVLEELPEPNRGLPVILMTGYPSAETAIRAVNRAVLAYLVKPMEFQELLEQVRRGVAQRRIQLAVSASADRVQAWAGEMAELSRGFAAPGGVPVSRLLGAMLGHMGEALLDMKRLVDLSAGAELGEQVCSVRACPRLASYQRIFQEGIEILEKTKSAFKSRTLEELRRRMESAVENPT